MERRPRKRERERDRGYYTEATPMLFIFHSSLPDFEKSLQIFALFVRTPKLIAHPDALVAVAGRSNDKYRAGQKIVP